MMDTLVFSWSCYDCWEEKHQTHINMDPTPEARAERITQHMMKTGHSINFIYDCTCESMYPIILYVFALQRIARYSFERHIA